MAECTVARAGAAGGGSPWVKIAEMSWVPSAAVEIFSGGIMLGTITIPIGFDIQMIYATGQLVNTNNYDGSITVTIQNYCDFYCSLKSGETSVINDSRFGAPPNWPSGGALGVAIINPNPIPGRLGVGTRVVLTVFGIPNP